MILWLLACGGDDPEVQGAFAEQFAGPAGAALTYAPLGDTAGVPRLLHVADDSWEVRAGDDWEAGQVVGTWTRSLEKGLVVGDATLLPERLEVGASGGGVTVESEGEWTVWYGTFPETFEVTVGDGDFAGTAVFAEGVGPVQLTLSGEELELVYYELDSYDTE